MDILCTKSAVGGEVAAPASKSSMQRAVACATLAQGWSSLHRAELCDDSRAALGLARSLGAEVRMPSTAGEAILIRGSGRFAHLADGSGVTAPEDGSEDADGLLELDCGESGLCMRMFTPIAALLPTRSRLVGHGSLVRRPMSLVEAPLAALGSRCETSEGKQPITVLQALQGGHAEIDAGDSSQLLTGLLIALPLASQDSELVVRNPVSKGYLDLTIDTCAAFGVCMERNSDFSRFRIPGSQSYKPHDFTVEGDWSGAAFLVAAAALAGAGNMAIHGLLPDSSQPDRAVLDAASAAGLGISWTGGDAPILNLERTDLAAFDFDATDCPDLFPPLAVLATGCRGVTRLRGIHRLRAKESDRAASITAMLAALGTESCLEDDSMFIEGRPDASAGEVQDRKSGMFKVDARGDHRIAMAAAIAALRLDAPVLVKGAECVAKSWPDFFEDLESFKIR